MTDIGRDDVGREWKKGSAELLVLSLLENRQRHGYELSKEIEKRSEGRLRLHIDSLYPLLHRLEQRKWIQGTWVSEAGKRRRRSYKLTAEGRRVLARQRKTWAVFVDSVRQILGPQRA